MKHTLILGLFALGFLALTQCTESSSTTPEEAAAPQPTREDTIKRGEYLVRTMGCHDCHTPKKMGPNGPEENHDLLLAGHQASTPFVMPNVEAVSQGWAMLNPDFTAFVGPWGVSFTGNLTSDETGIGNWTFEQFNRALRQGKYKGLEAGRPLLPPMPWFNYTNANEEDLRAIFAYLKSTKPIKNVVPPPIPPDQLKAK